MIAICVYAYSDATLEADWQLTSNGKGLKTIKKHFILTTVSRIRFQSIIT